MLPKKKTDEVAASPSSDPATVPAQMLDITSNQLQFGNDVFTEQGITLENYDK